LFFFEQHRVEQARVDLETLYGLIGRRPSYAEDGTSLSEWTVPAEDVRMFLAKGLR
jgi:hypothetical protein